MAVLGFVNAPPSYPAAAFDLVNSSATGGGLDAPASVAPQTVGAAPDFPIVGSAEVPAATTERRTTISDPGGPGQIKENRIQARLKRIALRIFSLDGLRNRIFGLPFWVALIFTLVLERIIPAEPKRQIFGVGFAQDMVWFLYEPVLHALVFGTYVASLKHIYDSYLSYLTFSGLTGTPGWFRFVVALLLLDLGYWVQHFIQHKVPLLWRFHSVHHSQRELNFFTDFRIHPLEYFVRYTFVIIPFLFLAVPVPVIVGFAVVKEWYSRFYHGNIRTNLGPLKYILVTPQSHRVHHSLEDRHRNTNFGAIFSFWDFFFRKQYRGFEEYPATGIDEKCFPHPQQVGLKKLFLAPWQQMLHPFSRRSGT